MCDQAQEKMFKCGMSEMHDSSPTVNLCISENQKKNLATLENKRCKTRKKICIFNGRKEKEEEEKGDQLSPLPSQKTRFS